MTYEELQVEEYWSNAARLLRYMIWLWKLQRAYPKMEEEIEHLRLHILGELATEGGE